MRDNIPSLEELLISARLEHKKYEKYTRELLDQFFSLKQLIKDRLKLKQIDLDESFSNLKDPKDYNVNDPNEYNVLLMAYIVKYTIAIERPTIDDYTAAITSLYPIYQHLQEYHFPFGGTFRGLNTRHLPNQLPYYFSTIDRSDRRYQYAVKRNITKAMRGLKAARATTKKRRNPLVRACYSVLRYIGKIFGVVSTTVNESQVLSSEPGEHEDTRGDGFRLWTQAFPELYKKLGETKIKQVIKDFERCFFDTNLFSMINVPNAWRMSCEMAKAQRYAFYRESFRLNPGQLLAIAAVSSPKLQEYLGIVTSDQKCELIKSPCFKASSIPHMVGIGRIDFDNPISKIVSLGDGNYQIGYGLRASDLIDQGEFKLRDESITYKRTMYASANINAVGHVEGATVDICQYDEAQWQQFAAVDTSHPEGKGDTSEYDGWHEMKAGSSEPYMPASEGGFDSGTEVPSPVLYDASLRHITELAANTDLSTEPLQSAVLAKQGLFSMLHAKPVSQTYVEDIKAERKASLP
ncbi:MAG: hypothetical protein P1U40_04110 [Coxiellaceae bacterium]|nr:hypothetical protein [Coxiellaceae bacterium]